MKKITNVLSIAIYALTAIVYIVTLVINYGSVSESLDGFHGFSGGHAIIFAVICVALAVACAVIIVRIIKEKQDMLSCILGVILIVLPVVFTVINVSLPGNVDTDIQGLMLRTSQGFENMSVFLIISSVIGFLALVCTKFNKNN